MSPERRVRLDLAYDGTDFAGWQFQPRQRTVQGCLEAQLHRLSGDRPMPLRAAGRTDSGVHARQQVADGLYRGELNDADLAHALNRVLPGDLRATSVLTVAETFHSRRHALHKTYAYRVDTTRSGDPLRLRQALHWPHRIDRAAIDEALRSLPGRRDWTGFTGAACTKLDRVRTVERAAFGETGPGEAWFVFEADGFLTYMVRNLVGTLLAIGRGRLPVESIGEILATGDRGLGGPTAPAHGLLLWNVRYAGEGRMSDPLDRVA